MTKITAMLIKLRTFILKHPYISVTVAVVLDCLIDYAISRIFHLDFLTVYAVDSVLNVGIISINIIIRSIKLNRYFEGIKHGYVDPVMCAKINGNYYR